MLGVPVVWRSVVWTGPWWGAGGVQFRWGGSFCLTSWVVCVGGVGLGACVLVCLLMKEVMGWLGFFPPLGFLNLCVVGSLLGAVCVVASLSESDSKLSNTAAILLQGKVGWLCCLKLAQVFVRVCCACVGLVGWMCALWCVCFPLGRGGVGSVVGSWVSLGLGGAWLCWCVGCGWLGLAAMPKLSRGGRWGGECWELVGYET